jgi:hypothetical protein
MLHRCSISVGIQFIRRSAKPGNSVQGLSRSPRSTHASSTGKFAQIFGPRRAKTLRNSIAVTRYVTLQVSLKQNGSKRPNTIYAANCQKVVSAGFFCPITTGNSSRSVFPSAPSMVVQTKTPTIAVSLLLCIVLKPHVYMPHKHPALPHSPQTTTQARTITQKTPCYKLVKTGHRLKTSRVEALAQAENIPLSAKYNPSI